MNARIRQSREEIISKAVPVEQWPEPMVDNVPGNKVEQYWRNRRAVEMYANGQTGSQIFQATKLKLKRVSAMFRSGGNLNKRLSDANGFFACIPGWRAPGGYTRNASMPAMRTATNSGMAGALGFLFSAHPKMQKVLLNLVHKRRYEDGHTVNFVSAKLVHKEFMAQCRLAGLTQNEYPFNTSSKGYAAINAWTKHELTSHPIAKADNLYGESAMKDTRRAHYLASAEFKNPKEIAYGRVQLDGHLHDSLWVVEVAIKGAIHRFRVELRPWVVTLMEQETKAILSHVLTFQAQYSRNHLLKAFRKALVPWAPMDLSAYEDLGFGYETGAGFPSMIPELAWNRPRELAWDRLSSQVALASSAQIRNVLGIHSIGMEGVGEGAARGEVEGFFNYLASEARQLPNATGRHPKDPARRDPGKAAARLHMNQNLAELYLEVLLANYNAKPVRAAGGQSPLEQLQECLYTSQIYLNPMPESEREKTLWKMLPQFKRRFNRTKHDTGPLYIELYGARYTNTAIAWDMNLLRYASTEVTLYVEDDARFAHLVVPEANQGGERYLGRLEVVDRRWRHPHPIEERKMFSKFGREALAEYKAETQDPTLALTNYLVRKATDNRVAASVVADMEIKRASLPEDEGRQYTDAELELMREFESDEEGELQADREVTVTLNPAKPDILNPHGFGGRII